MVKTTCGSRLISRLRYFLLLQSYYFAILIGITALKFDFKTRKFCNSRNRNFYVTIINVTVILVAPVLQWHIINNTKFYGNNSQMKLVSVINLNLRCAAAILTIVLRWKRERQVKKIVESLIKLEKEYFDGVLYPDQLITKFDTLFFLKYISVCVQSLSSLYFMNRYMSHMSTWWYVTVIYKELILNILHGVVLHFYIFLLCIGSRFHILNYRLNEIYLTLKKTKGWKSLRSQQQMQKALAAEMDYVTKIHCSLMNIVTELNDSYMFQILTVLITHVFYNIAIGYYGLMMCYGFLKIHLSLFDIVMGSFIYFCLVLDLYLVDVNCSTVQNSYDNLSALLKKFNNLSDLEPSFVRSCELLSLHLMHKKLFINIYGMFNLNKKTSFIMFGFTVRQVFILIQNDLAIQST